MKKALLVISLIALITASAQTQVLKKIKIDRKLETQLVSLFDQKPQRIELYQSEDKTYIVEALYKDTKMTRVLTGEEYRALLEKKIDKYAILENARVPYLIGQTTLGLTVYSWSAPIMVYGTDANDNERKGYFAIMMFTPLVYAGSNFFLTRGKTITGGAAYGSFLGGVEGAFHGGFGFGTPRAVFPVSLAENLTDLLIGQYMRATPAMFQRKFTHSLLGYYHYFMARALITNDFSGDEINTDLSLSSAVSGLEGYASLLLSRRSEYLSYGDALFELRTSEIGAQTVPLILLTFDLYDDTRTIDPRYYAAGSLAGFLAGYYIGNRCSVKNDLSGPAGFFTYLLPALCYTAAGGVAYLINNENFTYALPAAASVAEIGLTAYIYKNFAQNSSVSENKNGFNLMINPAPLFCRTGFVRRMPMAGLHWSF